MKLVYCFLYNVMWVTQFVSTRQLKNNYDYDDDDDNDDVNDD
jgi:hypothetical protein